jgi:hypothetical protein
VISGENGYFGRTQDKSLMAGWKAYVWDMNENNLLYGENQ